MTTHDTLTQVEKKAIRRELYINQAIDERLNTLLVRLQQLMDDTRIWQSKMELNQLQNVLAVAQETGSVEVVKNYIRYQMGRDNTSNSWRRRAGTGPAFGDRLISELDHLHDVAETITQEKKGSPTTDKTWMALSRLYLGYLRRYFYYQKRTQPEGNR
jgi:hypothetical protein